MQTVCVTMELFWRKYLTAIEMNGTNTIKTALVHITAEVCHNVIQALR